MVGAAPGLKHAAQIASIALTLGVPVALSAFAPIVLAATTSYVPSGSCRDGRPHGAYELRMPDGQLRVAGAFNQGKRTGTFLFWTGAGVRIALLPFDDDVLSGTVALWYSTGSPKSEPKRKLETVYAAGLPAGGVRSWYPDGRARGDYRYTHGALTEARAWNERGSPLSETDARAMAARDSNLDEQFYSTLEAIVRDHPPPCDDDGKRT